MMATARVRPLRIAQVAPLWTSVPPATYGGAELMVHWLTEELVRRGHSVSLFASGDSTTAAKLEAVCERNLVDAMARGEAYSYEPYASAAVAEAFRRASEFDVIHCHTGAETVPLSVLSSSPVLHTIHTDLAAIDERWALERYPDVPIAAISRSQLSAVSARRRANSSVIHHGCDFSTYVPSFRPGGYLAFLGRMGPHKNPVGAIRIAQSCGLPIVLAGDPQDSAEERYFEQSVNPLINGNDVVHVGKVGHQAKVTLLRGASALLFPIQWDEPFGLVMIEAMACGTPVLATRRGAVPEVVDAGKTGYFADTSDEIEALVASTLALDRGRVREHALGRFSHLRMVDAYVELYTSFSKRLQTWNTV